MFASIVKEVSLKTVCYAYGGADAALIVSRLESAEIPVFAHDFHTAITYSEIGGAMGGIRIAVPESHVDEALALLADNPLPVWKTPRLIPLLVMTLATLLFSTPFHARGTILATPNGRYTSMA